MQTTVSKRLSGFEVSTGEKLSLGRFLRKELDQETGFYYFGARYLDPKTSVWISADPAMGDYVPRAPIDGEAKRHNENLPGMGGVYIILQQAHRTIQDMEHMPALIMKLWDASNLHHRPTLINLPNCLIRH
jgi:RHS repeat-associated protein